MQPYTLLCITVLAFASTVLGRPDDIVFPDHMVNTRIRKNRGTETTTPVSISTQPIRRGHNRPPVRKSTVQKIITTTTPKPMDDDPALEGQIPLHVIRQLNEIEDVEQFFKTFEKAPDFDSAVKVGSVGTRLLDGDENAPRANVETPKAAKCEPELTTVSLYNTSTNTNLIFPSCTRVLRCGGCCNSELLSCQPTATGVRDRFFQVYASEYINGRVVPFSRKEVVKVEEHTKCTCGCRIKAEHCNDFQEYVQEGCRCRCINYEDKQKCENDNVTKIWDYNACMCRCRDTTECSTGFFFNENTCSCKPEPILYSRYGSEEQVRRKPPSNRYGYNTASSHPANSRYRTPHD